ncbi:MAG: flagellar motor protein [Calothrix sp. MO_192.B10]|nr:flagellar motor protein [Calothrix sp. MO_192.B10]
MAKRLKKIDDYEELNVWSAFTDLMSNAFMILLLFLLIAVLKSAFFQLTSNSSQDEVIKLYQQVAKLKKDIRQKNNELARLKQKVENRNFPPPIVIQDSPARKFESGSAELSPGLRKFIETELVKLIEDYAKKYPDYAIIDVIGHTDGQLNLGNSSNLDEILEKVAQGQEPISSLQPGSNADLGLMRALAVVKSLENIQKSQGKLTGLKFRPYSAAQLFLPQGDYAPPKRNSEIDRRRIEIRFTPTAVEQGVAE